MCADLEACRIFRERAGMVMADGLTNSPSCDLCLVSKGTTVLTAGPCKGGKSMSSKEVGGAGEDGLGCVLAGCLGEMLGEFGMELDIVA